MMLFIYPLSGVMLFINYLTSIKYISVAGELTMSHILRVYVSIFILYQALSHPAHTNARASVKSIEITSSVPNDISESSRGSYNSWQPNKLEETCLSHSYSQHYACWWPYRDRQGTLQTKRFGSGMYEKALEKLIAYILANTCPWLVNDKSNNVPIIRYIVILLVCGASCSKYSSHIL